MSKKYEIVKALRQAVKNYKISIKASSNILADDDHYYQRVQFSCGDTTIDFPIMDEFSDIEIGNPVVLLNFILQECTFFEEAQSYEEWCEDIGLAKNKESSVSLYKEISECVPVLRSILGSDLKPLNSYDIEFNTSITQALRATINQNSG